MFKQLLFTGLLAFASSAQALNMCDSGSWYEPASNGQGLSVEISNTRHKNKPNVVVYYYTYAEPGLPIWVVGVGNQSGNYVGLDFAFFWNMSPPYFNSGDLLQEDGGTGTFTLKSSKTATFTYDPSPLMRELGHTYQTFYLEKLFDICE